MFKRVVVGISGGVDSAVTALLLKNKGFNVIGVFMKNWDIPNEKGVCTVDQDYEDAKWIGEKLNIPLVEVNFVKDYWNDIFCDFVEKYQLGYTPNPDILCNKHIKFNKFFRVAKTDFNADAVATGHYVRTSFGPYLEYFKPNTDVRLYRSFDVVKDQSFFLSQIPQESLRHFMFPVGIHLKREVKQMAEEAGLMKVAKKKESMGICFIGSRNFQDFISEYVNNTPGHFIDLDTGKVLKEKHDGIHYWTIGQRCRIGGQLRPYFVFYKDIERNNIIIVQGNRHPALFSKFCKTESPHWIVEEPIELTNDRVLECHFRFQNTHALAPCRVFKSSSNELLVQLNKPLRALAKGQYAVFYRGEECLGSAAITYTGPSYFMLDQEVPDISIRYNSQEGEMLTEERERCTAT